MNYESYFTIKDSEWQQQSYYESQDHPATEDVKFPAKLLLWIAVSEYNVSKPVFFKSGRAMAVNNEL
jgi:hypothetical protein